MKTIRITSKSEIYAIQVILESELEAHGDIEITVKKYKLNMSDQQRRLYWMWIGILADFFGNEKDDFHLEMKKKFLIGIYIEHHEGFSEMVEAVRLVKSTDTKSWEVLAGHILSNVSITDANVSEMAEYLTLVDRFAIYNGVRLPLPEDQGMDLRIWKR